MYFWTNRSKFRYSLNSVYRSVGISKQGFSKQRKNLNKHLELKSHILDIVMQVRKNHPTMSCRTIYFKMRPEMLGRDRFEAICREYGLIVSKDRGYKRTTDSSGVIRFPNLIKDVKLEYLDQVWSSDITYFEVNNVFYYITFILDNYSRHILGHHSSRRLLTEESTLPALRMAIKTRGSKLGKDIIFHSDGGGQYYAKSFLKLTKKHSFQNSMCEMAWENGKAERINGVIKNNYLKHWSIDSFDKLTKMVDRAVKLYNQDKPHSSLDRMSPIEFEKSISIFKKQKQKNERVVLSKIQVKKGIEPILT